MQTLEWECIHWSGSAYIGVRVQTLEWECIHWSESANIGVGVKTLEWECNMHNFIYYSSSLLTISVCSCFTSLDSSPACSCNCSMGDWKMGGVPKERNGE